MEEHKNDVDINEIEEHDYMEDVLDDLGAEYDSQEKYQEDERYVEENFWNKIERAGKKISFTKDLKALFNYFIDRRIPWYRKTIVVGALVYFILPIDTIPDLAPLVGYLDDLGVVTAVIKYMGSELIPFYD